MPRVVRDLKMHLLKQTINYVTPHVLSLCPNVQAKTPQSKLVLAVWARLEDALRKEASIDARDDKNLNKLLESTKRALVFLCENDKYYRRWLGLLMLLLAEETQKAIRDFSYDLALLSAPRPLGLTREQFEQNKAALFQNMMSGYLYALSDQPESITTSIREAYARSGAVQVPTSHKRMAFSLRFEKEQENDAKPET